jgi:hypothetical protein
MSPTSMDSINQIKEVIGKTIARHEERENGRQHEIEMTDGSRVTFSWSETVRRIIPVTWTPPNDQELSHRRLVSPPAKAD